MNFIGKLLKTKEQPEEKIKENKDLEKFLVKFVDKLENKKIFDEKLKEKILGLSTVWNKEEVFNGMVKQIEIFQDYNEEEINFNWHPFIETLSEK